MVNFAQELPYVGAGPPTVGQALLRAKQRYFNSMAGGALSNYDEKVLGELTLYGLPMLGVRMPTTTSHPPGQSSSLLRSLALMPRAAPLLGTMARPSAWVDRALTPTPTAVATFSTLNLAFSYTPHNVPGLGIYYTIAGEDDLQVSGGRPIQPRASVDIHQADTIAHGVLLTGGMFTDTTGFDPLISRVVTDEVSSAVEPLFPGASLYTVRLEFGSRN